MPTPLDTDPRARPQPLPLPMRQVQRNGMGNTEGEASMKEDSNAYLGDGVYASYDGYQIWLAVNHHENIRVAIEPKVMRELLAYASRVWGEEKQNGN